MSALRPTLHETMMDTAYAWAARSTCNRLSVGAVLARDGMVLSTGYNGAPRGLPHCQHPSDGPDRCTTAVHAEMNALIQAAYHGQATKDATLYVTHEPCRACSGPIINAGIVEVRFAEHYARCNGEGIKILSKAGIMVWSSADSILRDMAFQIGRDAHLNRALRHCACGHTIDAHDSGSCGFCACLTPIDLHAELNGG